MSGINPPTVPLIRPDPLYILSYSPLLGTEHWINRKQPSDKQLGDEGGYGGCLSLETTPRAVNMSPLKVQVKDHGLLCHYFKLHAAVGVPDTSIITTV